MDYPASIILDWIANFMWPLTRILSMFMVMTFFGAQFVTQRMRIYLGILITLSIAPLIPKVPDVDLISLQGYIITAQQIVIGVAMGMIVNFVSQTFVVLGQILGMQSSLGFASMVDPTNGQNTPVLGQFFLILVTMLFLALDGHLQMIEIVSLSFQSLPVGKWPDPGNYRQLALWFGLMFRMAMTIAVAGVIALLTVNISFGIMTRAAPQLNVFSLGFAFVLILGFVVSGYIVAGILPHYEMQWQRGLEQVCNIVHLDC